MLANSDRFERTDRGRGVSDQSHFGTGSRRAERSSGKNLPEAEERGKQSMTLGMSNRKGVGTRGKGRGKGKGDLAREPCKRAAKKKPKPLGQAA